MQNDVLIPGNFQRENRTGKLTYKLSLAWKTFLSLPKTIYVNFRCFPASVAVKLPVLVAYNTRIIELHKGSIRIEANVKPFMIKLGFGGSDPISSQKSSLCLESGTLIFEKKASFGEGVALRNSGNLKIGDGFFANRNCTIWCSHQIEIGTKVLFGWNVTLRDHDGHMVLQNGQPKPITKPIRIGDHVWVCSESHLLKGAEIQKDSVVGYKSLVNKAFEEEGLLIAGHPAKKISDNINWERG